MLRPFLKYQSLGNDFIIFDWYKKTEPAMKCALAYDAWKDIVINLCKRYEGIGADGVLILKSDRKQFLPEMLIFNADGSAAQNCLNGLRCIAHYLRVHYSYPTDFSIKIGNNKVACLIDPLDEDHESFDITTFLDFIQSQASLEIETSLGTYKGYQASAGNPHFILFQKVALEWLRDHGALFECHAAFPEKTNVEFVWEIGRQKNGFRRFQLLVYERGCGITRACGSGASAVVKVLFDTQQIQQGEKIILTMLGGDLLCWVDEKGRVALKASASLVFRGDVLIPEKVKSVDIEIGNLF